MTAFGLGAARASTGADAIVIDQRWLDNTFAWGQAMNNCLPITWRQQAAWMVGAVRDWDSEILPALDGLRQP
jgi:hypothetical protein